MLSVLLILQTAFGAAYLIYRDELSFYFAILVNETIRQYRHDPDLENLIDFAQEQVSAVLNIKFYCFNFKPRIGCVAVSVN